MQLCINNSKIIKSSLDMIPDSERDIIIQTEFKKMCSRFNLNESNMISLISTINITLLNNNYESIWDSLNYYSMDCMDNFKNAYIKSVYENGLKDDRIKNLCDDLQNYITENTCINIDTPCNAFIHACKKKHWNCVKYLIDNPDKHDEKNDKGIELSKNKIKYDKRSLVDYLCFLNVPLEIVKYLFEVKNEKCTDDAINRACENGNLEVVKYLSEVQHVDGSHHGIRSAYGKNHRNIVEYLFEVLHYDCDEETIYLTVSMNSIDVVKYLFEIQHKKCKKEYLDAAISCGSFDMVKYLFEVQHMDCDDNVICSIIDIICYEREYRDVGQYLEIMGYLLKVQHKKCPKNAINIAIRGDCLDVVKYLLEEQHEECPENAINIAIKNNYLDIVKYLLEKQHEECPENAINIAIKNNSLNVIIYLLEERHEECPENVIDIAIENDSDTDIVEYLYEFQKKKIKN